VTQSGESLASVWQEEGNAAASKYIQLKCYSVQHKWNLEWSNVELLLKRQRNITWSVINKARHNQIQHCLTSLELEQLTTKTLLQNSNRHEPIELWAVKGQKYRTFRWLRTSFLPRDIRKNPRCMCARVPQAMAQFALKIEKLSHIMGPAPILQLARAYGLHPRLWLLSEINHADAKTSNTSIRIWFYYIITKIHPYPRFKILDPRMRWHSEQQWSGTSSSCSAISSLYTQVV